MNIFIETIVSKEPEKRDRSFYSLAETFSTTELMEALLEVETFRKETKNLYDKVRAILFFICWV